MTELPWFKFNPSEWLSGDIQYCSDAAQLLFVKLCCIYWKNNCQLDVKVMRKRCKMRAEKLQKCVKELQADGMIIINNDNISIKFLDEQYAERVARSEVNSNNGRLGGLANAKQSLSERYDFAKHGEGEEELDKEEEEEDGHLDPLIFDYFKDKGCYMPHEDSGWFTKVYNRFSDNFLNMVIRLCKEQRSSKGLPPKPCRSDLTTEIEKQSKKFSDGVFREQPTDSTKGINHGN